MSHVDTLKKPTTGYSQIPDSQIFAWEHTYGASHYGRLPMVVRKAEGAWLTSLDDRKYLDCLSAYSAANPGHHHPKIVQALVDALQGTVCFGHFECRLYRPARAVSEEDCRRWSRSFGPRFGNNGNKVLPKNGGVESVETAIKLDARVRLQGKRDSGRQAGDHCLRQQFPRPHDHDRVVLHQPEIQRRFRPADARICDGRLRRPEGGRRRRSTRTPAPFWSSRCRARAACISRRRDS